MNHAEDIENFAATQAWITVHDVLIRAGTPIDDLHAARIAALWLALEIAADGLSKDALRRMVFGEEE